MTSPSLSTVKITSATRGSVLFQAAAGVEQSGLVTLAGNDLGLIGLGVMGQNLALNFRSHGYSVVVYNRTAEKTREFVARHREVSAGYSLSEFVKALDRPRKIFLMVTAGSAVDATITDLSSLLSEGDIVMDGGNSFFQDTERRHNELAKLGVRFLGVGVSGGEEGALHGPSLMVGGAPEAYEHVKPMLTQVAAQAEGPCCQLVGSRGAGHYVKMVHNAIEYAILQTIAEAYDVLSRGVGLSVSQVRDVFDDWNHGNLGSFLMEIAVQVLGKVDPETGRALVSLVLDRARQKGTGKWASQNAMDLGVPVPTIDAAVSSRNLSSLKDERVPAARVLARVGSGRQLPRKDVVESLRAAAYASIVVSYAQGFHLLRAASREYGYGIPLAEVARIWKGGCIIRSKLLEPIKQAFMDNEHLQNLMVAPGFAEMLLNLEEQWRELVKVAKGAAIPIPAINASLDYFDAYRSEMLPANLIQALRDRFGAHGFERVDKPGHFHADWSH